MSSVRLAGQHAAGNGFGILGAVLPVVGAEHGRPHPGKRLARKNFFPHAEHIRPMRFVPLEIVGLGKELSERVSPTIEADFRGDPILLQPAVRNALHAADHLRSVSGNNRRQFDQFTCVHFNRGQGSGIIHKAATGGRGFGCGRQAALGISGQWTVGGQ